MQSALQGRNSEGARPALAMGVLGLRPFEGPQVVRGRGSREALPRVG